MNTKRLFVGSMIESAKFINKYSLVQKVFVHSVKGKWVETNNLHFTYHFLGNVAEDKVDELKTALAPFLTTQNYPILIKGLKTIPNLNNPKVLAASIYDLEGKLLALYHKITETLKALKIPLENKEFIPHITFVRIKFAEKKEFQNLVRNFKLEKFEELTSFNVNLIESKLTNEGPIYSIVE